MHVRSKKFGAHRDTTRTVFRQLRQRNCAPYVADAGGILNTPVELLTWRFLLSQLRFPLELWGGAECTVNRVGDVYYDQYVFSGHGNRTLEDLEMFAGLGLRTLRVGLQWERFAQTMSWTSADTIMRSMEEIGLQPIVGLLHHGSGPSWTDLLDPNFPQHLSAYASQVAQRFPWVTDYTPINEPQTTGRFACLYEHWFPHHRDMRSYLRALFHQMKGIALAMAAIRATQPEARLIHTEDAGLTYAVPALESFRVEREHRRWLGTDLLCGRVTREHALFNFLLQYGLDEREVLWFEDHPCPPDVLGLNYYVTSDRFLDDRLDLYPPFMAGGDTGSEPLVDIEAVRVRPEGICGIGEILKQAWQRYGLPLAITEAHLGCDVDEQIRWLAEIYADATAVRKTGVDVRGVTVWGLLGLKNWNNLCTKNDGVYEPGVFDCTSTFPVPTDLAALVRQLAHGQDPRHPALASVGWWRQPSRLTIPVPVGYPIPSFV